MVFLAPTEVEELQRHESFSKLTDAYGCLGVLQIGKIYFT